MNDDKINQFILHIIQDQFKYVIKLYFFIVGADTCLVMAFPDQGNSIHIRLRMYLNDGCFETFLPYFYESKYIMGIKYVQSTINKLLPIISDYHKLFCRFLSLQFALDQ